MSHRLGWVTVGLLAVLAAAPPAAAQTGITRYVNRTDATCGGQTPCYATIQAAVNAAQAADTIQIQAGLYVEQVTITGKNIAGATEGSRIIIQADPAAALGSVVLHGAVTQCTNGFAIQLQQSKFITIRGLTITGAGGQAISLLGGTNQNTAIHIERNRIVGNGSTSCSGGILIAGGNPDTLIVNNLIYANGGNGLATSDPSGGPHDIIGNTIHGNRWAGVAITRDHQVFLVNNAITGNTTAGSSYDFGVVREASTPPNPAGIQLLNNLICGNQMGEISGPVLDATDSGNLTPTGTEGPGVAASPGCGHATIVYKPLAGPDGLVGTADDDFTLATGSPAIDRGIDPRTLGLPTAFNPLLEADFAGNAARPKNGTGAPAALFDMGALEAPVPDTQAPTVSFLQPAANAWLRQTVTVQAQATDAGSGVASLILHADNHGLTATLSPTVPPPAASVTATASWNTTTFADGTHTLTATAADQATNSATVQRAVLVDNTPPQVQITGGPSGQIATTTATFTFTGTDNLTPVGSLVFAWRLDGGAYTAFTGATTASVSGLADGLHLFEVKARDLAGNESAPPASRSFTVATGVALTITSVTPSSGPIGTAVTITGTGFVLGGTSLRFNSTPAIVQTNTGSTLTTSVPLGASTGPLTVTTAAGSVSQTFTVTTSGDFTLSAAPAAGRAIAGDQAAVSLTAVGTGTFTSLVTLSVSGAPAGITASLSQAVIAPGGSASLTLAVAGTVAPGTYSFTITGQAPVDGGTLTRTAAVTLDVLAATTPAVTGRVMTAEAVPLPIPGVTITLGSAFTLTDAGGNFVLLAPPPGANMLLVDGRTASTPSAQYPPVEVNIPVSQTGPTRVPFIIYLPKLDTANAITLPTDATGTVTLTFLATTPTIPGLTITIPAGTRIIGPDGNPVTQLIITPVPIDRSPMPYPPGVTVPLLFSIQPGGAVPSQPLPITFPNLDRLPAGTRATLYFFDLVAGNWATWGTGTVSADQAGVVSDPGFGLPRFAWHFFTALGVGDAYADDSVGGNPGGGDPVNLATGRFDLSKTDLVIPGRLSIAAARTYRGQNQGLLGSLGIGWNLDPYDAILFSTGANLTLLRADQRQYLFTPSGVNRWVNTSAPFLAGAVITPGSGGYDLRFKDGTIHRFASVQFVFNGWTLAAIIDRNGNTATITREFGGTIGLLGRISQVTEPAGRSLRFAYDTQNRIITASDSIGRLVQYTYDALGRLTSATDPTGGVTRYAYDASHRIVNITDPKGITYLTNQYDATGRVTRQTQADGGAWQFTYLLSGAQVVNTTATNPRGNATVYRFDGRGFLLSQTDALGQTTVYDYTPGPSFRTAVTDPLGRVTRLTYDAVANVLSTTRLAGTPQAQTWTYTYEPTFSQIQTVTDPLGHTTIIGHDSRGNPTSITNPIGKVTTLTYNVQGQPLTIRDPLGDTWTLAYDGAGNLATVQNPLGNTTTRLSDGVGRLVSLTDPLGNSSRYQYDPLNRLTQISDALSGLTGLAHDANGKVMRRTDARGNAFTYSYDAMDRLDTRRDPLGRVERYQYDENGNVRTFTDRKGQARTRTYDALDRLTGATYADGSTTAYTWDAGNRLIQITDSLSGIITRNYDSRNRLTQEITPRGTVSYTYDNANRRTSMTVLGQLTVTYSYDNADRLTILTQGAATVTMGYDDANRRTSLTLPNSVQTTYVYDTASRLTSLTFTNGATTLGTLTYTYDAAGRRTSLGGTWARTGLPQAVASASYNVNNQQMDWGGQTNTFDLNGNLATDGTNTYTWDARNRLATISGASTASFQYDSLGRRTRKTIAGQTTDFLYDRRNPIQELSGGAVLANLLTGLRIDEYFTRIDGSGRRTLLGDALGSILALTDDAGTVQTSYTYEPFGNTSISGQANGNSFQYTGRENDQTGLYFYRARHYDPRLQRFVSEDPLRFRAGINFYRYVRNNPIRFRDPRGLSCADAPVDTPIPEECPGGDWERDELIREMERERLDEYGRELLKVLLDLGLDISMRYYKLEELLLRMIMPPEARAEDTSPAVDDPGAGDGDDTGPDERK